MPLARPDIPSAHRSLFGIRSGDAAHRLLVWTLALFLAVLFGCRSETSVDPESGNAQPADAAEPVRGGTVTVPVAVEMLGVNELTTQPTTAHTALHYFALFQPLILPDPSFRDGPPRYQGVLAERWEMSEDRRALTFSLRPEATWSDGTPITAEDVVFTWSAQTSPAIGWAFAEAKARIQEVEALDAKTVRFHYSEVYATQLFDAALGVVLPAHAWSELPFERWAESNDWFLERLVVSGPFTVEDWSSGERVTLARNDRYWRAERPFLDRLVFEVVSDRSLHLPLLERGSAHFLEFLDASKASDVEADLELALMSYPQRGFFFVVWNTLREPFDQAEVRRGLTLAIDRQEIVDSLYFGRARVPASPFPSDSWVHHDELEPLPYDPAEARRIFEGAGFADTDGDGILERDGKPFRFEMVTNVDNDLRRDALTLIQEQLRRVGVEVVPRLAEFNALLEPLSAHEFDSAIQALGVGTDFDLSFALHSRSIDGGLNWGAFNSPAVDEALDAIRAAATSDDALGHFHTLQELLHGEQPLTLLYEPRRLCARRSDLVGTDPNGLSSFFGLENWALAQASD